MEIFPWKSKWSNFSSWNWPIRWQQFPKFNNIEKRQNHLKRQELNFRDKPFSSHFQPIQKHLKPKHFSRGVLPLPNQMFANQLSLSNQNADCMFLSYHVTFQSESTLHSCLNVKGLLARNRRDIWSLINCNGTRTHNHFFRLNGRVFVYELSGCGFESCCSH